MLRAALIRMFYMSVMFLAGLVLSNLALPEKFGSITLLVLNASLLSLITGFGSQTLILYKVSNGHWNIAQAFQYTWRIIFIQLAIFLVFDLGSVILFRKTFLSGESSNYFFVDAIYFSGLIIVEKYLALFYALFKPRAANIILALIACGYLFLLLLFYYLIKVDFVYVLYAFAFQNLLQAIVLIVYFGFDHSRNLQLNGRQLLSTLKISSIVVVTNVIQLIAYRVDFWLLKHFYDSYAVGLYAQANKFANLCWVVPNILAQLLYPHFTSLTEEQKRDVFSVSFYSNFLVLLVTVICAHLFYGYYLKPEYSAGLSAFYLMLPGYFFWASVIYFGGYVSSAGKFFYNLLGSTLCLVFIFIADMVLIPQYGIKGAAIANSIVYGVIFCGYVLLFKRQFSLNVKDLFWLKKNALMNVIKFTTEQSK